MNSRFLYFLFAYLVTSTTLFSQVFDFIPKSSIDCEPINHSYFKLCYIDYDEQALWVAYFLTAEMVKTNVCKRNDNFRPDPKVSKGSAQLTDYKNSGYDRGHLCPAADMSFNCTAMSESFYLSNMSPQNPSFNRGIWSKLERKIREWAVTYDTIYVITAGVLSENCIGSIGKNSVTIPKYFYKVLYRKTLSGGTCIGFLLPNEDSQKPLDSFVITIDSLEKLTHINFFYKLSDSVQNRIENDLNLKEWKF